MKGHGIPKPKALWKSLLFLGVGQLFFFSTYGHAWGFYWEAGLGVNQMQAANSFFGATDAQTTGLGPTFSGTFATVLTDNDALIPFHLGIHSRYHANNSDTASFSMVSNYLMTRFEFWRFMVGGGFAPWVFKRSDAGGSSGPLASASTTGIMAQAGFLFPIIPTFLLSLNGTYETFSGSPTVYSVELVFRFYFGGSMYKERSPLDRKYKPWRYPYGWEVDK